jgi:hypothetical protein
MSSYGILQYGKEGARHVAESHLAAIDFHESVSQVGTARSWAVGMY